MSAPAGIPRLTFQPTVDVRRLTDYIKRVLERGVKGRLMTDQVSSVEVHISLPRQVPSIEVRISPQR